SGGELAGRLPSPRATAGSGPGPTGRVGAGQPHCQRLPAAAHRPARSTSPFSLYELLLGLYQCRAGGGQCLFGPRLPAAGLVAGGPRCPARHSAHYAGAATGLRPLHLGAGQLFAGLRRHHDLGDKSRLVSST
nr:hypothetical protein [Tanacetum cinerariifolium]